MKLTSLQKWFLIWFAGMVGFCYITYPTYSPIKSSAYSAHVIADRRIYFMNLRRYYYEEETDSASNFRLYNLKKWPQTKEDTLFRFILIDNWLQDEMYIMPKVNDAHKTARLLTDEKSLLLENSNAEQWHKIAITCYLALNENKKVFLADGATKIELFTTNETKKAALTVLEDYLKLVRQIS